MATLTKATVDAGVRAEGIKLVDTTELIQISGGKFLGKTVDAEGTERFFEIAVVAKSAKFTQEDVDAILTERVEVEERKADRKVKASAKAERDAKRRAEAKAKAEVEAQAEQV